MPPVKPQRHVTRRPPPCSHPARNRFQLDEAVTWCDRCGALRWKNGLSDNDGDHPPKGWVKPLLRRYLDSRRTA